MHTEGKKKSIFLIFRFLQFRIFSLKKSGFSRIIFFHFSKKNLIFFLKFFFNFAFWFCIKFHILKSQIMYLLYFFIYYHFNMQYYPLFQLKKPKNRKNRFFLCLLCAHSKIFMRQLFDIMLFSKNFFMIFWHLLDI